MLKYCGTVLQGILQLPVSSLVEEFTCTKVRTELLLAGSKDVVVSKVIPNQGEEMESKNGSSGGRSNS